jgi:protocatechuate 3,4-dioxygenase beta subunit
VLDISDDRVTRVQIEAPPRIPEQSVEGIVVDGSGAPVPGAIVSLFDANWKREAIARALSGSDGRFIVQALQGRQYGIQASTSSRLPGQSNLQEVPSDGTTEPMKLVVQPANR